MCLSLEEKLWIIRFCAENEKNRTKIALAFAAKFNRTISRQCVSLTLKRRAKILESTFADSEQKLKTAKTTRSVTKARFETDLAFILEEKNKTMNVTYETVRLTGKDLQNQPEYADCAEVQSLKFSNSFVTSFLKTHGLSLKNARKFHYAPVANLEMGHKSLGWHFDPTADP